MMISEEIDVAVTLPRNLWEAFVGRAQSEQAAESALLIRALEQFLQQPTTDQTLPQQLAQECTELAELDFTDVGTEDEWLIVQNEALHNTEMALR